MIIKEFPLNIGEEIYEIDPDFYFVKTTTVTQIKLDTFGDLEFFSYKTLCATVKPFSKKIIW